LDLTKLNRNRVVETLVQKDEDAAGLGLKAASTRRASREVSGTNLVRKGSVLEGVREEPHAGEHGDVYLQRFGSVGAVCVGLRATSTGKTQPAGHLRARARLLGGAWRRVRQSLVENRASVPVRIGLQSRLRNRD
jgi:hypothetical protein